MRPLPSRVRAGVPALLVVLAASCAAPAREPSVVTPALRPIDAAPIERFVAAAKSGTYGNVDHVVVLREGRTVVDERIPRDYTAIGRDRRSGIGCGVDACETAGDVHQYNYLHPRFHPWWEGRDVHTLQSVTKSVTATLIGIALHRGEIDSVGVPLLSFFGAYPMGSVDPRLRRATLADLLTMRTGIEWHESDRPLDSTNTTLRLEQSDDWIRFTLAQPMDAEPRTKWVYNSGGSQLMAEVLRSATGTHADAYAERLLFAPLGIRDYHWKRTPTGHPDTEGGLYLGARDLAKIGELYLADGVWNGVRLLPAGWAREATARHVDRISEHANAPGYGYQWWRHDRRGAEVWAGNGFGGQFLVVLPAERMVGVVNAWNVFGERFPGTLVPLIDAMLDAAGVPAARPAGGAAAAPVLPGIEVFVASPPLQVRGKRVALITNHSAIDRSRNTDIDLIARHPDMKLVALLAPEHGIRGTAAEGAEIGDEVDAKTGVPIHSLYKSEDQGPSPEMLRDVDAIVYDLQEVGGRTWTYVSTMALSMMAAKRRGIPFVVLDRPNPIGGEIVEGALLDPRFRSFVGMYPIPARHGMTVGELATLFNTQHGIGADLVVVKAANWRRNQWFEDTGLPWVNPSPNLRSPDALKHYPGTVYFEGTNLTEGRGTDRPFEQVGAPWLDAPAVAAAMNARGLAGVRFEAITMPVLPTARKHAGLTIPGIRLLVTDRERYRPVRTALLLIDEIRRRHPGDFAWTGTIDRLTGSDRVRLAIEGGTLPALLEDWDREAAAFTEARRAYLLYP